MRTYKGTRTAHRLVAGMEPPRDEKEYRKFTRDVAVKVSKVLGNTPSVALASYICPSVWAPWQHASPASRNDRVEQATTVKRTTLPQVHYGAVGSKTPHETQIRDEADDDRMPRRLPQSTIRLLGYDPRELSAPSEARHAKKNLPDPSR